MKKGLVKREFLKNFFFFPLNVKGFQNFEQSIQSSLKPEIISDEKGQMKKTIRISIIPPILVIMLKRFEYNVLDLKRFKIHDSFEFPFEYDFSCLTEHEIELNYILQGIVVHSGEAQHGHYYSFIKQKGLFGFIFMVILPFY